MARFTPPTSKPSKNEEPKTTRKEFSNKHLARVEREARQRKWLLGGLIAVGIAVIGFIGYGILDQFVFQNMKPVAIVNGEKIKAEDLIKRTKYVRSQMGKQYEQYYQDYLMFAGDNTFASQIETYLTQLQTQLSAEYAPTITENVLDRMMEEILISQKAAEMGITVTEEEVDIALQDAFGYFPNGTPDPTATATEFLTPTTNPAVLDLVTATPTEVPPTATATLEFTETPAPTATATATVDSSLPTATPAPTATPMTAEGYATTVAEYLAPGAAYGFTEEDFRYMYRIQLLEIKLAAKITEDLKPMQEQVWARHILVANEATAKELYAELQAGADFAQLAQINSLDTSNASTGGDLGWFGRGTMVEAFETAAFALKPGEISEPVKTEFGWHIIQCIDHAERVLTETEFNNYKQKVYTDWLEEQKAAGQYEKLDHWKSVVPLEPGVPVLQQ